MEADIYRRLADHLDRLPGGYPPTESGVELRILRRLFAPEEAELALHLTLLAEEPRVVARRAGLPVEQVARRLAEMERKGLIYGEHRQGKPPTYMAMQFVVGIYEFQVGRLDAELAADFEEYLPTLFDADVWRRAPQLRTIPVGESVEPPSEVLPYERAEALVRAESVFAVAPCICREEQALLGHPCSKPLETCLVFGAAAEFYVRNGLGRAITRDEALDVLKQSDAAGLVLQPNNARALGNICACCGCCCGVLRSAKRHPRPAEILSSAFRVVLNAEACQGCGICVDRCQMDALSLVDGRAALRGERCIGCGLCVTTCPAGALTLERKPASEQPYVPRNAVESALRLGRARGLLRAPELAGTLVRSALDRLISRGAERRSDEEMNG
jgi:electron transport complex protein RnfB